MPTAPSDRDDWVPLRVRLAGICGTDLNMMTGRDSLALEPEATYPFVPGHEIVGQIEDTGSRMAVWAAIGCRARGLDPCPPCRSGWDGLCQSRGHGWPGPGLGIGFNRDTSGGWATTCLAHRSQLWPLPDTVSDQDAVMLDPAATALAALLRAPTAGEPAQTLVIGGGSIGLLAGLLHRALQLPGECEILVRYKTQAEWAQAQGLRATVVSGPKAFHAWAADRGIPAVRVSGYGYVFKGHYDRVVDAAGSNTSVHWAFHTVRPGGCIASITSPLSLHGFDPTLLWYREVTWRGIYVYGPVPWAGESVHPYAILIPQLADGSFRPGSLVTHIFPLEQSSRAIRTALHRGATGAIKVAFSP